jgi:hypothetical protein
VNPQNVALKITIVFLLLALSGCGGDITNNVNSGNSSNIKNEYPQEVADAFLQSCQGAGSKPERCSCVLDKIQRKYTFEEFSVLETKMRAGRTPDEFLEFSGKARAECMN